MTIQEISALLAAPFDDSDIEWRLSSLNKEKTKGTAVPYVTNRAIQNRLDTVLGIDGWKNEYHPWHPDKKNNKDSQLCGISIWIEERGEWLTKYDGAEDSDIESVKGGLSDSMKRAAVHWGIGRYLYNMQTVYVELEREKYIKQSEYAKLDAAHQAVIARSFQNNVPTASPAQQNPPASGNTVQVQKKQPQNTLLRPQQPQQRSQQPKAQANAESANTFTISKVGLVPSSKRGQDTALQLQDFNGKLLEAYAPGTNSAFAPGVILSNCRLTRIEENELVFHVLEEYTIKKQQNAA